MILPCAAASAAWTLSAIASPLDFCTACCQLKCCSGRPPYPALEDWIEIFRHSIGSFHRTAEADSSRPEPERLRGAEQFAAAYRALVDELERQALAASSNSGSDGAGSGGDGSSAKRLGCLELCQLRWVGGWAVCGCGRVGWGAAGDCNRVA